MAKEETKLTQQQLTPAVQPSQAAKQTPPVRTVQALFDYMLETGTPLKRLEAGKLHLADNPNATAEAIYHILEASGVQLGTLRKAGKWLWGDGFEPETAATQVPAEELVRLREENAQLKRDMAKVNTEKLAYFRQRNSAQEKIAELTRQIRLIKAGKPREELIAAGIDPA